MPIVDVDALYPPSYFLGHSYGADPLRDQMYRQERDRIYCYKRKGRILDVGCGVGAFLDCFDDRWEKWGIEPARFAAEAAQRRGVQLARPWSITDYSGYWNVIVFRGTIQHVPHPFEYLEKAQGWLADDGLLVLLATPNTNSPYYKLFGTLPALDPCRNFLLPSDLMMTNALKNMGYTVRQVLYPYLGTPYADPLRDHLRFFVGWLTRRQTGFAFWRSMMEIYATKT
jgi:cyclopropane fatty-acyl-phospholipid synthase-like methyltransferase